MYVTNIDKHLEGNIISDESNLIFFVCFEATLWNLLSVLHSN